MGNSCSDRCIAKMEISLPLNRVYLSQTLLLPRAVPPGARDKRGRAWHVSSSNERVDSLVSCAPPIVNKDDSIEGGPPPHRPVSMPPAANCGKVNTPLSPKA